MQTDSTSHSNLPAPIAGYFASHTTDAEGVARCFTEDAVVADERQEHRGRLAIAQWNAAANAKYATATEVIGVEPDATRTTVRARVTGNFPGGTVELRFRFTLAGALISRLEIVP